METSSVVKWKVLREGRGIGVWISACCHKDPEVTRGILHSVRYYFRSQRNTLELGLFFSLNCFELSFIEIRKRDIYTDEVTANVTATD